MAPDTDRTDGLGRRGFLRAGAGATLAAGAMAGASVPAAAQGEPDYGGWFTDSVKGGSVDNYQSTVDQTGQSEVTVEVGADGNGGTFAFAPAAVRIDPGTTVVFEWTSNTHNVIVEEQPDGADWGGHQPIENEGFSFEFTFETEGVYKYYCEPHLSLGMKGAIVVGQASGGGGGGGGQVSEPNYGGWFDDVSNYQSTVDNRGQSEVTVEVGAEGNGGTFAFAPAAVRIDPGTTVVFEWTSNTHNVLIEEQPDGADWGGHQPIENEGFSFEFTFETEGVYKYYCEPHLSLGMKGAIVVGDVGGGGGGGGGGGAENGDAGGGITFPGTPGEQVILLFIYGVGGLAGLAVLAADFYRRRPEEAVAEEREAFTGTTEESPVEQPTEELGHDEYNPLGTAALVAVYFLIITLMWFVMYFVEFLGNGPTVIG